MVRPRELQRACLRCQTWLWESSRGTVPRTVATAATRPRRKTATTTTTTTTVTTARPSVRTFSTTGPRATENESTTTTTSAGAESPAPAPEDMETTVRQAKALFGDTLPAGYLRPDEYRLYERLFGAPLRTTAPEDVGFLFAGQEAAANTAKGNMKEDDPPGTTLLRSAGGGFYEVVDYAVERAAEVEAEAALLEEVVEAEVLVEAEGRVEAELRAAAAEAAAQAEAEAEAAAAAAAETAGPEVDADGRPLLTPAQTDYIQAVARNQREFDALARLQQDFEVAKRAAAEEEVEEEKEEEEVEEEIEEEIEDDDTHEEDAPGAVFAADGTLLPPEHDWRQAPRLHPLTVAGKMRTQPSTVQLPKHELVGPITQLLKRTDLKHVRLAAETAMGGPGLPHSPATPDLRRLGHVAQQGVGLSAAAGRMSEIEADAFLATVMPFVYASATSVLVEVRRRLGSQWLGDLARRATAVDDNDEAVQPLRVLDAGGGGAAMAAWNTVLQAEVGADDLNPPAIQVERIVLAGSDTLRQRVSRFLNDTSFVPRLPDLLHSAVNVARHLDAPDSPLKPRKTYDVIVASHQLLTFHKDHQRRAYVANLWAQLNPAGGVLIVVEKAHPRGFEAVAEARKVLLGGNEGTVVAPCTTNGACPMYLKSGLSPGRKDFCHFRQRFLRPPFLQTILGKAHRNNEDVQFSYVAVRRGETRETADGQVQGQVQGQAAADAAFAGYDESTTIPTDDLPPLPRTILPPLKRQGHVILDVCTPAGALERWTVPRSFGKQAYHDARKAQWGDLWALGAKGRVARAVRLGKQAAREAAAEAAAVKAREAVASARGVDDDDEDALHAARRAARTAVAAAEAVAAGEGVRGGPGSAAAAPRLTPSEKRAAKRGRHRVVRLGLNTADDLLAASKARRSKRGGMNSDMSKLLEAVDRQLEGRVADGMEGKKGG